MKTHVPSTKSAISWTSRVFNGLCCRMRNYQIRTKRTGRGRLVTIQAVNKN